MSYFANLFETRIDLLNQSQHILVDKLTIGKAIGSLETKNGKYIVGCSMPGSQDVDFCGIQIELTNDSTKGIDLSSFTEIDFKFKTSAPISDPKMKLTFRNYNDNYSVPDDLVSQKYNSIIVTANDTRQSTVPISYLHVETWWINERKIAISDSQVDVGNVSKIDILHHDTKTGGDYIFELNALVLKGQYFSLTQLLIINSVIWILVISLLIVKQRQHLIEQATKDRLTGLTNRRGLQDWIDANHPSITNPVDFSLIYIDLDDFKKINDTYGHKVGDLLLKEFSKKTRHVLRAEQYDNVDCLFVRMSGDEFIILLKTIDIQICVKIVDDLFHELTRPIDLEDSKFSVSLSIGISTGTAISGDLKLLFEEGDMAMYLAKKTGKNQFKVYRDNIDDPFFRRKQLAREISSAIENNEFELSFMPTFHADTKRVNSVEVLLNVNNAELKKLSSTEMTDIAEEFNLINTINTWVIATTFKNLSENRKLIESLNIIFSINISTLDLQMSNTIDYISQQLYKNQIDASWIEFEISEAAGIVDQERTLQSLHQLKSMGFKLAIDNFGNGFTAFEHLSAYPIQKIKINRSFVEAIKNNDTKLMVYIAAIMDIAGAHALEVTASGVENLDQFYYLKDKGCRYVQGHLFSEPHSFQGLIKSLSGQGLSREIEV
ncbi:putative bifunctional diguanylate cyclase/phosphodiesterase [Glaciecola petra]|uniref:EAL domain-containing protein n=1 Tax=Glaciecola petra TaxID=3075602 RepID=A0ABU2ZU29_9ALTE|nr:EAL domain-containing protein [Aestuariibacter sp. P117]MDT0595084.1 EAL domain-containing protein [Aestuariibacter sp. P117]